MELIWALPSLLECPSTVTQDIMGISGFKIILCPSVVGQSQLMSDSKIIIAPHMEIL